MLGSGFDMQGLEFVIQSFGLDVRGLGFAIVKLS